MNRENEIKRGEIYLINLNPTIGAEIKKTRPCIVIQNNIGNLYSNTTIIAPITSKKYEKEFPTNLFIKKEESELKEDSTILFNQIRTIDKKRIIKKIGKIPKEKYEIMNEKIRISLEL